MRKNTLISLVGVAALAIAAFAAGASWAKGGKVKEAVITMPDKVTWTPLDPTAGAAGPQVAVVFGNMKKKQPLGLMMKFPAGMTPGMHSHSSDYFAVPIAGDMHHWIDGTEKGAAIGPGGFWMQPGKGLHDNHCASKKECVSFAYFPKGFDYKPAPPPKDAAKAAPAKAAPAPAPAKAAPAPAPAKAAPAKTTTKP